MEPISRKPPRRPKFSDFGWGHLAKPHDHENASYKFRSFCGAITVHFIKEVCRTAVKYSRQISCKVTKHLQYNNQRSTSTEIAASIPLNGGHGGTSNPICCLSRRAERKRLRRNASVPSQKPLGSHVVAQMHTTPTPTPLLHSELHRRLRRQLLLQPHPVPPGTLPSRHIHCASRACNIVYCVIVCASQSGGRPEPLRVCAGRC